MKLGRRLKAITLAGIALGTVGLDAGATHAISTPAPPEPPPPDTATLTDPVGDSTTGRPGHDLVRLKITRTNGYALITVNRAAYEALDGAELRLHIGGNGAVVLDITPNSVTARSVASSCAVDGFVTTSSSDAAYQFALPQACIDNASSLSTTLMIKSGSILAPADTLTSASGAYAMVTADGHVHSFGVTNAGGVRGAIGPPTMADIELTASGGYYLLDVLGHVTALRGAPDFGNAALRSNEQSTAISVTPSGNGYWIFTDKGRVIPFGNAKHFGDMSGVTLNGPVLDSIATPSGNGYYMVASDGGVFAFGDARFAGSMGGIRLNAPVQSLVPDPDGTGYWLVASDGGVFAFDATFRGSMGATRLNKPVTGMVPNGNGYLMVGEDGGIFNFSDQPFHGSLGANPPASPVVAVTAVG